MTKILELIRDPVWWFSAFFIAVVASIFAAFLKDWVSIILSRFSSKFRRWNQTRLSKTDKYINTISESFELLVESWFRTIVALLGFSISSIIFLLTPILGYVSEVSPFRDSIVFFRTNNLILWLEIISVAYGISSVVTGYMSGTLIRLTFEASRRYRRRKLSSQKVLKERKISHADDCVELE